MKSLEQSNLSALNSTDSLPVLNNSTGRLSALLAAKGWRDLSPEIYAAESADQAKEQRLRDALQSYALQPDAHHGWELLNLLREAETELQTQYAYAKKQQMFYQDQAEQEAKSGGGVIADWTQWLWHGVQDFFGSSSEALVEKYARMAVESQRRQAELSIWTAALQQELLIDSTPSPEEDQSLPESTESEGDTEAEEIKAIDTPTVKAAQRHSDSLESFEAHPLSDESTIVSSEIVNSHARRLLTSLLILSQLIPTSVVHKTSPVLPHSTIMALWLAGRLYLTGNGTCTRGNINLMIVPLGRSK